MTSSPTHETPTHKTPTHETPIEWRLHYDAPCSLYTHPAELAAVAQLAGHTPPPLEGARVLEVGCALGGNLSPIAATLPPSATLIGVDPFAEQIEQATRRAEQMGLHNVTYLPLGVEELDQVEGEFDYIICHGLLSWIPKEAQLATFEMCARRLSPRGVAYISYNTYPKWHQHRYVRDLLRWRGRHLKPGEAFEREARRALSLFARYASTAGVSSPRALFSDAHQHLSKRPDYYLAHEYLLDENHPYYFHEFIERLAEAGDEDHGLCYLADASLNTQYAHSILAPSLLKELSLMGEGQLALTQQLDFLVNRSIRRSLLIRSQAPRAGGVRGCPPSAHPQAERALPELPRLEELSKLWISSPYVPSEPSELSLISPALWRHRHSGETRKVSHPLSQATLLLASVAWPQPLSGALWATQAVELATSFGMRHEGEEAIAREWRVAISELLYYELILPPRLTPPLVASQAPVPLESAPPKAAQHLTLSAPARSQLMARPASLTEALEWREVTSLYHTPTLASPALSALLPLLHGTLGWAELLEWVSARDSEGELWAVEAQVGAVSAWGVARLSALSAQERLAALLREAHELALLTHP